MLSDTGKPGFMYFLNTLCNEWDVLRYHKAWEAAELSMNRTTVMRALQKQVQFIIDNGSNEEKENAIRLKNQLETDSKVGNRIDSFWSNRTINSLKTDQLLAIATQAAKQAKLFAISTSKSAELFYNDKPDQPDTYQDRNKRKMDDINNEDDEVENRDVVESSAVESDLISEVTARSLKRVALDCSEDQSLKAILRNYCGRKETSPYDPAHSFILDLSPSSKIQNEFIRERWDTLVASKPDAAQKSYHHEIESLIAHLFGKSGQRRLPTDLSQAREKWYTLRNLPSPEYSDEFSYAKSDWKKICRWFEKATGQFLDAFESPRNPLQTDCQEREWFGDYIVPLLQGALKLDGNCRVPWGEINILASQRRRNRIKDVLIQQIERGHMADLACIYEQHELVCALACGGPHNYNITKIASDEFSLSRMMKDMLDDLQFKFPYTTKLYVLGIQTYMTEIRIYLMEKRDVYRLHLLKSFFLPITFSAFRNLRVALKWAWDIRGMINDLILELEPTSDDDNKSTFQTPALFDDMKTKETPTKTSKKKGTNG